MPEVVQKELSYEIIGIAMQVYNELGYGFLEKVYENALMLMFKEENIKAEQQKDIKVKFKGSIIGNYIADILVEDRIILELKSVSKLTDKHKAQTVNYLKATGLKLGIILNFSSNSLEFQRVVL